MKNVAIKSVKGYNAFSKIISNGKKFKSDDIFMTVIYTGSDFSLQKSSEVGTVYYGVSSPKKLNPKAIVRNRIKRLLRVSIRKCINQNPDYANFLKYIILIYNKKIQHPGLIKLKDIEPKVNKIINKSIDHKMKEAIR